jgi:membrane protein implicated in regulation of membrane protease activity
VDVSVQALDYWHWLSIGIVLLIAEVAFGGASFLMWVGFAALFTGVVTLLLPALMPWQVQLVVFGVASVASVLLWRRYVKDAPVEGGVTLNKRGAEHIGKVVVLEEAIVGGNGRIRIDDTLWGVQGVDAPAGSHVRIEALDGNVYRVTPA